MKTRQIQNYPIQNFKTVIISCFLRYHRSCLFTSVITLCWKLKENQKKVDKDTAFDRIFISIHNERDDVSNSVGITELRSSECERFKPWVLDSLDCSVNIDFGHKWLSITELKSMVNSGKHLHRVFVKKLFYQNHYEKNIPFLWHTQGHGILCRS